MDDNDDENDDVKKDDNLENDNWLIRYSLQEEPVQLVTSPYYSFPVEQFTRSMHTHTHTRNTKRKRKGARETVNIQLSTRMAILF